MRNSLLTRRSFFTFATIGVAAIGSQLLLTACGSGGSTAYGGSPSGTTSGGNCDANGSALETTGVTEGHTHTIQLTAAEISAADVNAVFTTSNVGHTHSVQLTSAEYASLQANQGVSLNTGAALTDGHIHTLSISCA